MAYGAGNIRWSACGVHGVRLKQFTMYFGTRNLEKFPIYLQGVFIRKQFVANGAVRSPWILVR